MAVGFVAKLFKPEGCFHTMFSTFLSHKYTKVFQNSFKTSSDVAASSLIASFYLNEVRLNNCLELRPNLHTRPLKKNSSARLIRLLCFKLERFQFCKRKFKIVINFNRPKDPGYKFSLR